MSGSWEIYLKNHLNYLTCWHACEHSLLSLNRMRALPKGAARCHCVLPIEQVPNFSYRASSDSNLFVSIYVGVRRLFIQCSICGIFLFFVIKLVQCVLSASYDGGSAALGHLVMTIWRWLPCVFSCENPCSGLPELAPGPHPPPVDCRKMTEEAAGKGEPVWMQGHVAHAASVSSVVTAPPAHLPAAPCAPAADPAMSLFPRQMQLGAQPITELKLFMHPKPTMHPHLSQFSYIFQERPPGKPPGKGDPTQVFWVKPDQNNPQQAAMPGVKDKMNEKEMSSNENHEGDSPSLPGMSTPSRPPRPHSAERQYKCKDCGKAFPQPSHLIRHTRTHTGEQPYKCDLCGRAFSDQSHRLRHLRTHIGVRTHKCEECGKEFFEPNHLVRHARRHTGERPYPCDQCGKAFCEQSGLNRHLRTHSGERPFKLA